MSSKSRPNAGNEEKSRLEGCTFRWRDFGKWRQSVQYSAGASDSKMLKYRITNATPDDCRRD